MLSIRRVLCPVDLSPAAAKALRFGVSLCSALDARLTTLLVEAERARGERTTGNGLAAFVADALGAETAASVERVERRGAPAEEILAAASALGHDLIVMATQGRSGVRRLLLGSVTENVLLRAAVPVVVVPPAMADAAGRSRLDLVLCAVDFGATSRRAVDYAAYLASTAGVRALVVHVLEWSEEQETFPSSEGSGLPTSEDDAVDRLEELIAADLHADFSPELVVGYGTAGDELLRLALERGADLIVLGAQRRNPIERAIFGSTARRLVRAAPCPVLLVR